jgi:CDGSH-type Zn-finger protein
VIKGPVRVIDHLGNAFPLPEGKEAIALCRCGASGNRPFCDGSHRTCGFVAPERGQAPPAEAP